MNKQLIMDIVKILVAALIGAIITFITFVSVEQRENKIQNTKNTEIISNHEKTIQYLVNDHTPISTVNQLVKNSEDKFNEQEQTIKNIDQKLDKIYSLLLEKYHAQIKNNDTAIYYGYYFQRK